MTTANHAAYVAGERFEIEGHRYDVSVYLDSGRYRASCFCYDCPSRMESSNHGAAAIASQGGESAIRKHHAEFHAD